MQLYKFDWGPFPRRILIYLREKQISGVQLIDVDVAGGENRTPEFLAMNPAGKVPVLCTDDGFIIRDSASIVEYLEARNPSPNLFGETLEAQAHTRDLLRLLDEAYQANMLCTLYGSPLMQARREPSREVARAMRTEALKVLETLEQIVGDGPFLGGSEPTYADVVFFVSEQFFSNVYKLGLPANCVKLAQAYRQFSRRPSVLPLEVPSIVAELGPVEGVEPDAY